MTWRIGIVDCDTPHVVSFTQRLNHVEVEKDQWVDGARIVAAVPGKSLVQPKRIPEFTDRLRKYGIRILNSPEELLGSVDAVMVESIDGSLHAERALPLIEAGLPLFVDKPFTCSVDDARRLVEAAQRRHVVLTSGSALRYAQEVRAVATDRAGRGRVAGVDTYSPGSQHPRNPGLFHYGVHAVEMMYALMGTGCEAVRCTSEESVDLAVGRWLDGRLGTVRATRDGAPDFGFTAFCERAAIPVVVDRRYYYRELLKVVVAMLETATWPLTPDELIEPIAFQQAALASAQRGGAEVLLDQYLK